jgi:hypothetical protein
MSLQSGEALAACCRHQVPRSPFSHTLDEPNLDTGEREGLLLYMTSKLAKLRD